ncbi:uncharacterized protein BXZ73DRAFT_82102 [Epithele typhae]|uniref:uncharacterized protein n=1 Tax=Epithele typhae TaxID=378194 RepID=UPI002007504A|nr:uncharacterized protein BXZ73DRAFT_82102 [Epithele typhae]KAH9912928.1 hypothetical protein BXZ73DRAFT_82102 [Epithele typhae]
MNEDHGRDMRASHGSCAQHLPVPPEHTRAPELPHSQVEAFDASSEWFSHFPLDDFRHYTLSQTDLHELGLGSIHSTESVAPRHPLRNHDVIPQYPSTPPLPYPSAPPQTYPSAPPHQHSSALPPQRGPPSPARGLEPLRRAHPDGDDTPAPSQKRQRRDENATPTERVPPPLAAPAGTLGSGKNTGAKRSVASTGPQPDNNTESGSGSRWSEKESTFVIDMVLGPDPIAPYNDIKKSGKRYFEKIALHPKAPWGPGKRTWSAVKNHYERLLKLFAAIVAFENMTGLDGDVDIPQPPDWETMTIEQAQARLAKAKEKKSFSGLTGGIWLHWHRVGWYDRFNDQLSSHPQVVKQSSFTEDVMSDESDEFLIGGDDAESAILITYMADDDEHAQSELGGTQQAVDSASSHSDPLSGLVSKLAKQGVEKRQLEAAKSPSKVASLATSTSDMLVSMTATLQDSHKIATEQLKLQTRQVTSMEQRQERRLVMEEHQFQDRRDDRAEARDKAKREAEEKAQQTLEEKMKEKVNMANALLANPSIDPELRKVASKVVADWLTKPME